MSPGLLSVLSRLTCFSPCWWELAGVWGGLLGRTASSSRTTKNAPTHETAPMAKQQRKKSSARRSSGSGSITSERNIYFYEMRAEQPDPATPRPAIDLAATLTHIGSLPFDDTNRY